MLSYFNLGKDVECDDVRESTYEFGRKERMVKRVERERVKIKRVERELNEILVLKDILCSILCSSEYLISNFNSQKQILERAECSNC